eukprot:scaffold53536_cov18-Tisochrysis_lutea.AAC.2
MQRCMMEAAGELVLRPQAQLFDCSRMSRTNRLFAEARSSIGKLVLPWTQGLDAQTPFAILTQRVLGWREHCFWSLKSSIYFLNFLHKRQVECLPGPTAPQAARQTLAPPLPQTAAATVTPAGSLLEHCGHQKLFIICHAAMEMLKGKERVMEILKVMKHRLAVGSQCLDRAYPLMQQESTKKP